MIRDSLPTFSGLEIAPALAVRSDTAKYHTALKRARDVFGLTSGGVIARPGFEWCGELYDSTNVGRLLPFQFSTDQAYVMAMEGGRVRFVVNGGFVVEDTTEEAAAGGLEIMGATNADPAVLQIDYHGYSTGDQIYVDGLVGGSWPVLNGKVFVVAAVDASHVSIPIDSTGFGALTSSTGLDRTEAPAPPTPTPTPEPTPPPALDPGSPPTYCPAPDVPILLEDGEYLPAGELRVGQPVYAWDEQSGNWGVWPVLAVRVVDDCPRLLVTLTDGRAWRFSPEHPFWSGGRWRELRELEPGARIDGTRSGIVATVDEAGRGPVVMITVKGAHTFVADGLLSHNKLVNLPDLNIDEFF